MLQFLIHSYLFSDLHWPNLLRSCSFYACCVSNMCVAKSQVAKCPLLEKLRNVRPFPPSCLLRQSQLTIESLNLKNKYNGFSICRTVQSQNYKIVDSFVNHWLFRLIFKSSTVPSGKVSVYEGCGHVR